MLLEERFDDTGYSGATYDRPALQRLLTLIHGRAVDRVVVHRFDRLFRNLLGCVRMLEELRECGVGLVITTALELGDGAQDSPAWLSTRHTLAGLTATTSRSSIMNVRRR